MNVKGRQEELDEKIKEAICDNVESIYELEFTVDDDGTRYIDLRFEEEEDMQFGADKIGDILDGFYDVQDVEFSLHIIARHKEQSSE